MPSWEQVRDYLRTRLPLTADAEDHVEMIWRFLIADEPSGPHVLQPMRLQPSRAFDAPWLLIMASVCPEAALSARAALLHNQRLAVGGLALDGPFYLLRHTMPLGSLSYADLECSLHAMAHESARLRQLASQPTSLGAFWSE